jgi:hypothetical protein
MVFKNRFNQLKPIKNDKNQNESISETKNSDFNWIKIVVLIEL